MRILIPLQTDTYNSIPTDELEIRAGVVRPNNVVIVLGDRQVEVDKKDLRMALMTVLDR